MRHIKTSAMEHISIYTDQLINFFQRIDAMEMGKKTKFKLIQTTARCELFQSHAWA